MIKFDKDSFIRKVTKVLVMTSIAIVSCCTSVYASNTYAEKAGRWILDGLFWVVVIASIFGIAMAVVKRQLIVAITILVASALVLIIINDPNIILTIGNTLKGIIGL